MPVTRIRDVEEQFYSRYDWCLNPILTIQELLQRLGEELPCPSDFADWQRQESRINIYLFACAISCTLDDYLARRLANVSALRNRWPQLRLLFVGADWFLNLISWIFSIRDRNLRRFRESWDACVEEACNLLLVDSAQSGKESRNRLQFALSQCQKITLPQRVLGQRMRLPEAFRKQDFAHHDVITLAHRLAESVPADNQPVMVLGLRTAGAYFAPIIAACLKQKHWSRVSWSSIRPKKGLSRFEKRRLQELRGQGGRVFVVDDYPATGNTFRLTLGILRDFKFGSNQITILAPTHVAQPNWIELAGITGPTSVITVQPTDLHKVALLNPRTVESLCTEYYNSAGWTRVRVIEDSRIDALNTRLAEHAKDGHHVREKRVFAIELIGDGGVSASKTILLKSVGWGWLAYHAYIAGKRLEGFVPPVIGLRNGLLLMEWINDAASLTESVSNGETVAALGSYLAARTRTLRLPARQPLESVTYSASGIEEIVNVLRAAYGPYVNRFKKPILRKHLSRSITVSPTLLDGQMRAEEWLCTPAAIYKSDFEHHNFGGPELDLVDPAYDLAGAIHEFRLSRELEQELLRIYVRDSVDPITVERILLHKILYGSIVMRNALDRIAAGKDRRKNSDLYHFTRNWLVYAMNEYCSKAAGFTRNPGWSESLFFMDLDGVFDQCLLGFPHATRNGLRSLALLKDNRYSIILNTGRGIENVRKYCEAYGLSGGVAEYGSVFLDAASGKETPLIDNVGAEQLAECREALKKFPDIFIDSTYEYSIRAFRYQGRRTAGLNEREVMTVLRNAKCDQLTYISREADTYIVQKGRDKGEAVRFVRNYLGDSNISTTAIGDAGADVSMLLAVEHAYAPANCCPEIRALSKEGRCRITSRRFQSGLLAAVEHRLGRKAIGPTLDSVAATSLICTFLQIADRQFISQVAAAFCWWSL